ncbi:MAG: tetratricopeptide repeat protein [Pirellula sp.]|jgi:TolA-binding protein|nr:tetratricopeptide repeat protein [Pirellula sp.]
MEPIKQKSRSMQAIVACCLLLIPLSVPSYSQSPPPRSADVALTFQRACEAFSKKDFKASQEEFEAVATAASGSELGIQAEYFSALSAWNLSPSDTTASAMQSWLENAHAFEMKIRSEGKVLVSPAWERWVESAHLILAKSEKQRGDFKEAENRLRQLAASSSPSSSGSSLRPSSVPVAWPSKSPCSPQVWLELGGLLRREEPGSDEALQCFEKAILACDRQPDTNNNLVYTLASWNAIQCFVSQNRWEEVNTRLQEFAKQDLSQELRIQSKLLEVAARKHLAEAVDVARELEPLVEIALVGNAPAQLIYDLAIALADAGANDRADEVFIQLAKRYPGTGISIEARLRLARSYAAKEDWKQAMQFAQEATELGCPDSWKAFAWYIQGKGHSQTGSPSEAIRCFEQGLAEGKATLELEVTLRVELLELLYQSEQWSKIIPHAERLLAMASKETTPPSWLPLVQLRQAETLANRNAWSDAEKLVSKLCRDFPEWNKADEADYLLARCCIARADFQGARERLDRIVLASEGSNATLRARAGWMTGETFMMQRRYSDAVASYERVLTIPGEEYWHAASALQIGVCAELTRNSDAAIEWYRRVQDRYPESPFAKTAGERLDGLVTSTKQAERIGSGKKR